MTDLEKSREELAAARHLAESGFQRQAVSRAYFAAFYAARAAVKTIGAVPKTHSGLRSKFADLARSTPALGPALGTRLADLGSQRGDADYDVEPQTTADDADQAIVGAEELVEAVERMLATHADE